MASLGGIELSILIIFIGLSILWLGTLVDILKSEFEGNNKIVWLLVVILLYIIGAFLYLFIGRQQKVKVG